MPAPTKTSDDLLVDAVLDLRQDLLEQIGRITDRVSAIERRLGELEGKRPRRAPWSSR